MLRRASTTLLSTTTSMTTSSTAIRGLATLPTPRFFDYDTIKKTLNVAQAFDVVEDAFAKLSQGKVSDDGISSTIDTSETGCSNSNWE